MRYFRAGIGLGLGLALLPAAALAHSNPASAQPPLNGTASTSPPAIVLTFDSPVVPSATMLHVLDERGTTVDHVPTTIDPTAKVATLATGALDAGVYTVVWTNQSAEDGHDNQGYYTVVIGHQLADRQVSFAGGPADQSGDAMTTVKTADLALTLKTPAPGLGPKPLDVSLSDDAGPVDKAFVRFRIVFGNIAANVPEDYVVAQPTPGSAGHYGAVLPVGILGHWTLKFAISRDGKTDVDPTVNLTAALVASSASASPSAIAAPISPSPSAAVSTPAPPQAPTIAPAPAPSASQPVAPTGRQPVLLIAIAAAVVVILGGGALAMARRRLNPR